MFYYRSVLVLCLSCSSIKPRRAPERHCSSCLKRKDCICSQVMNNFWKLQAIELTFLDADLGLPGYGSLSEAAAQVFQYIHFQQSII